MNTLQGQLLLASPQLRDPNFFQTVVLLVQHNKKGAMGLVLNRPMELTLEEAWDQVSDEACERKDALFTGGPCEGVLMALHGEQELSDIDVLPGVFFTTDGNKLTRLMQHPEIPARFFVGYSGWSANQLENEMAIGSWMSVPAEPDYAFNSDENLWNHIRKEIARQTIYAGLNPKVVPIDPTMN